MAAQHLPRVLVRPSSGLKELAHTVKKLNKKQVSKAHHGTVHYGLHSDFCHVALRIDYVDSQNL